MNDLPQSKGAGMEVKPARPARTCIVQLGRYGDILNILPVAQLIAEESGEPVYMLVHRDFADVLDAVSYVKPIIWEGNMMLPFVAAQSLRGFDRVIVSQVGNIGEESRTRACETFNMEQWRYSGYLDRWKDPRITLSLDRRNHEREARLVDSYGLRGKKFILVQVHGISGAFPFPDQLYDEIHNRFASEIMVVDMRRLRAEKFCDLLGFYDLALALVTIDTGTMHLAAASRVPTIYLSADNVTPWHGAKPRGLNLVLEMQYKEYERRKVEINAAILKLMIENKRQERMGRVKIPEITLVGVDNFTPARTIAALIFSMKNITIPATVLLCQPNPRLPGTDLRGIAIRPVIEGAGRLDRERFFLTDLHKHFDTSHCLHVEQDARVANPEAWNPEWLQYDYIGAPWPWPFDGGHLVLDNERVPFPPCTEKDCVGNLGFALMSKRFLEAVSQIARPNDAEARLSDAYMCRTLRPQLEEMGIKFAPEEVAVRFSCEDRYYTGQFGWHGRQTAKLNGFALI